MRLVFLDTGPVGMISNPKGKGRAPRCRGWVRDLLSAGVRVYVPEIADYEVRRELIRAGAVAGLTRLDRVVAGLDYAPITTDVMHEAARLWAAARNAGRPTAGPDALDGDCILAATAILAAGPGDVTTVATDNVSHLARFLDARPFELIVP